MHSDSIALSTCQIDAPPLRAYVNAAHAAARYAELRSLITGYPAIDYARPVVQTSTRPWGGDHLSAEKLTLEAVFFAAGSSRQLTRDQCRVWYVVRIGGVAWREVDGVHRSSVERWVRKVDLAVDVELDRRGLLVRSDREVTL